MGRRRAGGRGGGTEGGREGGDSRMRTYREREIQKDRDRERGIHTETNPDRELVT